jgi:hypothetical protein
MLSTATHAPDYKIFPYEPIEELAPGLWRVVGSMSVPIPRSMYVYRLPTGELLLHSVVAMHEPDLRALERLGKPRVMVIPHPKHWMDAQFYKERYPDIEVLGEADAQKKVPELIFDDTLADRLPIWGITAHPVPGMSLHEVAVELPIDKNRCALLFTDLINVNDGDMGIVGKIFGPPGDGGVARILKLTQIDDKYQVRAFLRRMAALPNLALVAGCHGGVVTSHCAEWLTEAAERL